MISKPMIHLTAKDYFLEIESTEPISQRTVSDSPVMTVPENDPVVETKSKVKISLNSKLKSGSVLHLTLF